MLFNYVNNRKGKKEGMYSLVNVAFEDAPAVSGGMTEVITAVNTAISSAATSLTGAITTNAPVILGVVAAGIAIAFGIKFVKKIKGAA